MPVSGCLVHGDSSSVRLILSGVVFPRTRRTGVVGGVGAVGVGGAPATVAGVEARVPVSGDKARFRAADILLSGVVGSPVEDAKDCAMISQVFRAMCGL